jgi:two-component system, NtrC family, sensor histidine kinase KinB
MLRWKLTLGLLATLIILLLVGVYGVWLFNDLGRAVDDVLRDNYDSIKVCHLIRTGTTRLNTFYARGEKPNPPLEQSAPLEETAKDFQNRLPILDKNAKNSEEVSVVANLRQACDDYLHLYRQILDLAKAGGVRDPGIADLRTQIPGLTLRITDLSEKILDRNEQQMLKANRAADKKAKDSIRLLVIAMASALTVFAFTYARLGNSLIKPIEKLTLSIRELRSRDFEQSLSVTTEDELGALTREFNAMAEELRNFYRETDRKIIELNQVVRAMMTTLPYPLFILGNSNQMTRSNPAAERLMDSLNMKGELPGQVRRHLEEAVITGADYRLDDLKQALLFRIDEQEFYFLPRIFRIVLEDGSTFGRALMLVDVTRFRWLDEMKSDMLSTLSHEIKTPLTGIRLVLHLLLEKSTGDLTSAQEEIVTAARNDCERLLKTLNSLLDLARMESGKAQLDIRETTVERVLEEVCRDWKDRGYASTRNLTINVKARLPRILIDLERILIVFDNFLSNARKYSEPGTEIEIRVGLIGNDFVRFGVINVGSSLSDEEQARVFDKFYRVSARGGEGAGLGLSIARQVVQAHEGRIGVFSGPGKKTEFFCDLPVSLSNGAPALG